MSNTIFNSQNKSFEEFTPVTKFENNVLRLICEEMNSEDISKKLNVNIHTINAYRLSLFHKFHTSNLEYLKKFCI